MSVPPPTFEEISARLSNHAVFAVIAETLDKWQPPSTPEGRRVLHEHYLWLLEAQKRGSLVVAGPLNMELAGPGAPAPIGAPSGLLVFRAASRADAEALAHQDPLHRSGFRRNIVCAWSIRWTVPPVSAALEALLATPLG